MTRKPVCRPAGHATPRGGLPGTTTPPTPVTLEGPSQGCAQPSRPEKNAPERTKADRSGHRRRQTPAELEQQATAMLRRAGAFRRGTGIRSQPSLRRAGFGVRCWEDWMSRSVEFAVPCSLRAEWDALAGAMRLSPCEKQVLFMSRVEERPLREIARLLGLTVHRVRVYLARAQEKCARHAADPPVSAQALFCRQARRRGAS